MAFTFTNYPILSPEQQSPWQGALSRALDTYSKATKASYMPQQIEADIYSKKFGPLAQLATSPTFMNDQNFQEVLRNEIHRMFPGNHQDSNGDTSLPTYAGQATIDADEAQELANKISHAGGINKGISSIAGTIESNLGDMGKIFLNAISGGAINSQLAQDENRLKGLMSQMETKVVQTKALSPEKAHEVFSKKSDETWAQAFQRAKRTNPALFNNTDSNQPNNFQNKDKNEKKGGSMIMYLDGEKYDIPDDEIYNAQIAGFSFSPTGQ